MASIGPRTVSAISLLALVPVALFLLGRSRIVVLSALCVLLITASLYAMFSPVEGPHEPGDVAGSP